MRIDIAAISLDVANFRHDKATTERDAIRFLLSDEKTHKVSELAQDIVDRQGLDPSSLLIVTSNEGNPSGYIALEGNRRIAALKALMTPDLAKGTPGETTFKSLSPKFLPLNITSVECVVLGRTEAAIWIKRKHYKGMGGAGIVAWNAVATARSDASEGNYTRWMTALAYLEKHEIGAEIIRESIASKTTTVERVLGSSHIASVLGLNFDKSGNLTPENGDEKAAAFLLQAILEAMSAKSFVETRVSSANRQLEFINQFSASSVKRPAVLKPAQQGSAASNRNSGTLPGVASAGTSGAGGTQPSAAPLTTNTVARSKPSKQRTMLAKAGLRISNHHLNKFYGELRGLNVEKNPHIAAAIIRVFLEKSSSFF
jgi:hypothetical protein